MQEKERRGKALNLLGSHRCLEVLVPQNHQENPEERRQTQVLVIDAPRCKGNQLKNRSPCTQRSVSVGSSSPRNTDHPSSSKPSPLHQHSCPASSFARPRADSPLSPGASEGQPQVPFNLLTNGSLERKDQRGDRKGHAVKSPIAEAAGPGAFLSHSLRPALISVFLAPVCQPWARFMWQVRFLQHHVERQRE